MWTMRPTSQPPTVLGPVNPLLSASGFREQVLYVTQGQGDRYDSLLVPPKPNVIVSESNCSGQSFSVVWSVSFSLSNQN